MAFSEKIDEAKLRVVREQLSYFLRFLGLDTSDAARLTIGESFRVFFMRADSLAMRADQTPSGLAFEDTGTWHHQLRIDNSPTAYARSGPAQDGEHWIIIRVLKSKLALAIDDAIEMLDSQRTDSSTSVDLLDIPAFQLHAFILNRLVDTQREILVVSSPFPQLQLLKLYREEDFRDLLVHISPIVGIKAD